MGLKKFFKKLGSRAKTAEPVDEEKGLESELLKDEPQGKKPQADKKKRSSQRFKTKKRNKSEKDTAISLHEWYYQELQERNLYTIRDASGHFVDIRATFAPKPKWWIVVTKLVITVWITLISFADFFQTKPMWFYLATFDHWASIVTVMYLFSSVLSHATRPPTKSGDFSKENSLPTTWPKITWTLFSIAAPAQLMASLAFWIFEYKGDYLEDSLVYYVSVWLLLCLEGLCLNRIPIRINHQWFFLGFVYLFLVWTLIHSYLNIGNPMKTNQNTLYPFLDWDQAPYFTALYSMLSLFVIAPLVYSFIWLISLFSFPFQFQGKYRRYWSSQQNQQLERYVEMN